MATYYDYEEEDLGDMEENLTEEELLEDGDPEVEDDPPLEDESEEAGQLQPTTSASPSRTPPRPTSSPSTPPRKGRNGPRASTPPPSPTPPSPSDAGDHGSQAGKSDSRASKKASSSSTSAQRKPRGNLPTAPSFDGNRAKYPKCFKKYANRVDSYVAIAEQIIEHSEIGLRLYAALEGEAADLLEDVPAKSFGHLSIALWNFGIFFALWKGWCHLP